MKHLYTLLIITFFSVGIFGQNTYRTLNGDIGISITQGDSILLLVSNELLVTLDYETSKVKFHVSYDSFRSGIDSIDEQLKAFTDTALDFTGKLDIVINPLNFSAQKYSLEGKLTKAVPPATVRGSGSMTCMPAGDQMTPACTLLLNFDASLDALNLTQIFPNAKPLARIDLRQSILEKMD